MEIWKCMKCGTQFDDDDLYSHEKDWDGKEYIVCPHCGCDELEMCYVCSQCRESVPESEFFQGYGPVKDGMCIKCINEKKKTDYDIVKKLATNKFAYRQPIKISEFLVNVLGGEDKIEGILFDYIKEHKIDCSSEIDDGWDSDDIVNAFNQIKSEKSE